MGARRRRNVSALWGDFLPVGVAGGRDAFQQGVSGAGAAHAGGEVVVVGAVHVDGVSVEVRRGFDSPLEFLVGVGCGEGVLRVGRFEALGGVVRLGHGSSIVYVISIRWWLVAQW